LGGTHVHHLNYGIVLLAGVGAYLLFAHTSERGTTLATLGYGVGLALTFDEFGMWLHLGGSYWQRASFDAIIVLAALLGLLGFAPPFRAWRPRHIATALVTLGAALVFYLMLVESFRFVARVEPRFEQLERGAPP
jgi:ABC-type branched-subunit amino acid transport system permease subunit